MICLLFVVLLLLDDLVQLVLHRFVTTRESKSKESQRTYQFHLGEGVVVNSSDETEDPQGEGDVLQLSFLGDGLDAIGPSRLESLDGSRAEAGRSEAGGGSGEHAGRGRFFGVFSFAAIS